MQLPLQLIPYYNLAYFDVEMEIVTQIRYSVIF